MVVTCGSSMPVLIMSTAIPNEVTPCLFKSELLNGLMLITERLYEFDGLCPESMRQISLSLQ